jgi:N-acetylmuramoyl-L-alanine amidase
MKIAIDPGHGMSNRRRGVFDPGAVHDENGFKFVEADIVLKYCLTLKDVFRAQGHGVFMTRDDSVDHAPVGERAGNSKMAGAQVLVSIHLNDFDDDTANGLEVLYRGHDDKSIAQKLQDALLAVTNFKDRRIKKREDLSILKFDGVAVLIELGFIANDSNRAVIINPQKRQEICETIANVVLSHFGA